MTQVGSDSTTIEYRDITRSVDVYYKQNIDTEKWMLEVRTDIPVSGFIRVS